MGSTHKRICLPDAGRIDSNKSTGWSRPSGERSAIRTSPHAILSHRPQLPLHKPPHVPLPAAAAHASPPHRRRRPGLPSPAPPTPGHPLPRAALLAAAATHASPPHRRRPGLPSPAPPPPGPPLPSAAPRPPLPTAAGSGSGSGGRLGLEGFAAARPPLPTAAGAVAGGRNRTCSPPPEFSAGASPLHGRVFAVAAALVLAVAPPDWSPSPPSEVHSRRRRHPCSSKSQDG
ncbi:hypothetical protein ACP4OV_021928 [Aristida adscensionis]